MPRALPKSQKEIEKQLEAAVAEAAAEAEDRLRSSFELKIKQMEQAAIAQQASAARFQKSNALQVLELQQEKARLESARLDAQSATARAQAEARQALAEKAKALADKTTAETRKCIVEREKAAIEKARNAAESISGSVATILWECQIDDDNWTPYDAPTTAQIDIAFAREPASSLGVHFNRGKFKYLLTFIGEDGVCAMQTNLSTKATRMVRRRRVLKRLPSPPLVHPPGIPSALVPGKRWHAHKGIVCGSLTAAVYTIPRPTKDAAKHVCHDNDHFSIASKHYQTFGGDESRIKEVRYFENEPLEQQFNHCRTTFDAAGKGSEEIWVYHGTDTIDKVNAIVGNGFKVGGRDPGVGVANGSSYGKGVYTAKGPSTPERYGSRSKMILLARALTGRGGTATPACTIARGAIRATRGLGRIATPPTASNRFGVQGSIPASRYGPSPPPLTRSTFGPFSHGNRFDALTHANTQLNSGSGGRGTFTSPSIYLPTPPDRSASSVGLDSWEPKGDWVIFKEGIQLLPVYAIVLDR
jgi:hypothetical protein